MKIPKYFILAVILALFLSGCSSDTSRKGKPMEKNFFAMDTYNTVTVYSDVPENVLDAAEKKMEELEGLWSVTDKGSEIYAINHANGNPVIISEETSELIQFSLDMAEKTGGALDISLYPVLTEWGFTTGENKIPSDQTLAEKMKLIGLEKISLSEIPCGDTSIPSGAHVSYGDNKENTISMQPGMQIDFGAVAKGYACDLLAQQLKENGVTSGILSLGGSICAIGSKPDGSDFKISVQNPEYGDSLGLLSISNSCVVTSGAYERYFVGEDGKEYGHILDPKTGKPAQTDLASVTVVGREGVRCDALSTALFVKGLNSAVEYYQQQGEVELLLVTVNGEIYLTENLKSCFTIDENYRDMPMQVIPNKK